MNEMPILKALRRLVVRQFVCPEWIIWKKSRMVGWEFTPQGFASEHELEIDFNVEGGNVRVFVKNKLDVKNDKKYLIPWSDPDCDIKVVKLIKDWMVMLWEEHYLDQSGFPNPSIGGERPKL